MSGRAWAYVGAILGGVVSIAANVAHSYVPPQGAADGWAPELGAVVFSVVWPVFLLVAVEVWARVPWPDGWRYGLIRFGGLLPVALVAAVVSYRHLSGLLAFYGEDGLTVVIGPLAVDGLMVMATGALIATGAHRTVRVEQWAGAAPDERGETPSWEPGAAFVPDPGPHPVIFETRPDTEPDTTPDTTPDNGPDVVPDNTPDVVADSVPDIKRTPKRTRRGAKPDTATAIARLRDGHPDMSSADIARRLGVTDRTVRRHLGAPIPPPDAAPLAA